MATKRSPDFPIMSRYAVRQATFRDRISGVTISGQLWRVVSFVQEAHLRLDGELIGTRNIANAWYDRVKGRVRRPYKNRWEISCEPW